jgi:isoamylase
MFETLAGQSFPVGASVYPGGVNFCVYSRSATGIDLLLFDQEEAAQPAQVIQLDPQQNLTYHYWHVFVKGIGAGQLYGYRAYGSAQPEAGLIFDPQKLLIDPYARCLANTARYQRTAAIQPGDNTARAMKCVVVDPQAYHWEGDEPLQRPFSDAIIYEMHLGGFTRHPSSGVEAAKRGTYAGLVEKIPYLSQLGVKIVELMPVQQFDYQEAPASLSNYWGYQPVAFFAPHQGYSACGDPLGAVDEFRDMVKALHRAGIEVILDVVFNHTAEAGQGGPILSLRGLDNPTYYILDSMDARRYADFSGTGNTINGNESIVRRMILDCLRYWVEHMHVDGFRFDLASILSRGEDGTPLKDPPILWDIETDPLLAGTKIIAEAWDAAGLYQVTSFIGDRWAVWNGQYRDFVRQFVKGDNGVIGSFADSLMGSAALYRQPERDPMRSINFITSHDGFTLNDLVCYNEKYNLPNGENNEDGSDDNYSWNCGVEGPSGDAAIERLREQQIKNFLTVLFMSQGRPMLLMGDEVRRSQQGNNNPYDQDNETSWFNWDEVKQQADILRFVRNFISFHQGSKLFRDRKYWGEAGSASVTWHGTRLLQPDWGQSSHALALELSHAGSAEHLHMMFNAYWEALAFELPGLAPGQEWRRMVDTALPSPADFPETPAGLQTGQLQYTVQARSAVILTAALLPA